MGTTKLVRMAGGEMMVRPPEGEAVLRVILRYPVGPTGAAMLGVIREAGLCLALPQGLPREGLEVSFVVGPEDRPQATVAWAVTGTRAQRAAVEERIEVLMAALKAKAAQWPAVWSNGAAIEEG